MTDRTQHIISKFRWDTFFDTKEKTTELQDRLSGWSRIKMPREITGIFDDICPPEQVWRIESLEIDLGIIDYSELEYELTKRLKRLLTEKLAGLVLHTPNSNNIEIIGENTNYVQLIGYYLLHGVIPWNYKPGNQSINQLLAFQLENNSSEVIDMLREVGLTHENVRKRIAWQISEDNIVNIIKGLEPNNHQQVIAFSNEMTRIQATGTIVQTSLADFKKNLWFRVLNYLLIERGSIFNKIDFLRSNIKQMAEHYHISYDVLVSMIERAISRVEQHDAVKADIVLVLKMMVNERQTAKPRINEEKERNTDHWETLKNYFLSPLTAYTDTEINDLVVNLSEQDSSKLRDLLQSLQDNELHHVTNKLNKASFQAMCSALSDNNVVAEGIYFLQKLCNELHLNIEQEFLWKAGMEFMLRKKNLSLNTKGFLDFLITQLSKKSRVNKADMIERFINVQVPSETRTPPALEIYTALNSIFASDTDKDRFEESIKILSAASTKKELFMLTRRRVVKYVQLHPKAVLEVLKAYPNKEEVKKMLPHLADEHLTEVLLGNADRETGIIVSALRHAASMLKAGQMSALIEDNLADIALRAVILRPELQGAKFLQYMLNELGLLVSGSQSEQFGLYLYTLINDGTFAAAGIPDNIAAQIEQRFLANQKLPVLMRVADLILESNKQAEVSRLLLSAYADKQFTSLRKYGIKQGSIILNYLLTGGEQLMNSLVKEYAVIISSEWSSISKDRVILMLTGLYWKCILNYNDHKGRSEALKKAFEAAVWFRFPVSAKPIAAATQATEIGLVEQCILLKRESIIKDGKELRLIDLLLTGAEMHAGALLKVLKNTPIPEELISRLQHEISFSQFSSFLANDAYGGLQDAIRTLKALYNLVMNIAQGQMADNLVVAYWKQLGQVISTNRLSASGLKKLLQDSLHQLARQMNADSELIIAGIGKRHLQLTPTLRNAFADYAPVFASLPVNELSKASRQLERFKQKGLLYNLSYHLVMLNQVPAWYGNASEQTVHDLLNEIITHHQVNLLLILKNENIAGRQITWLSRTVNFNMFTNAIGDMNKTQQSLLDNLNRLYYALGKVTINGIPAGEIQLIIFKKLIKAWTTGNWRIISSEMIWNELAWSLCTKKGVSRTAFIQGVENAGIYLPPSFQVSFNRLKQQDNKSLPGNLVAKPIKRSISNKLPAQAAREGIPVKNAGLVLINSYLLSLMERLGHIKNKAFINGEAQLQAVHYLQHVVTGLNSTEESLLPLNKVLCGLPLAQPVADGVEMPEEHKIIIEGLIKAMISHWPSIGESSVYGFRGNWLVRDGMLTEQDDRWELAVEKRAYDILLHRSPFSFSIIKYPWMNKPLHVNWPY